MTPTTVSELVKSIKECDSSEIAESMYSGTLGFSSTWVVSVFNSKRDLPVLDKLFDVHNVGTSVLIDLGVDEETRTLLFSKWDPLTDDQKSSWVSDCKYVDLEDPLSIKAFVEALSKFLLSFDES